MAYPLIPRHLAPAAGDPSDRTDRSSTSAKTSLSSPATICPAPATSATPHAGWAPASWRPPPRSRRLTPRPAVHRMQPSWTARTTWARICSASAVDRAEVPHLDAQRTPIHVQLPHEVASAGRHVRTVGEVRHERVRSSRHLRS